MRQAIALFTSCFTLYGMWLAGSHKWQGWALGIFNQFLWLIFIFAFQAWGLLPLNIALVIVYSRNLLRWRAEVKEAEEAADAYQECDDCEGGAIKREYVAGFPFTVRCPSCLGGDKA